MDPTIQTARRRDGGTPRLECDGGVECVLPECTSDEDCAHGTCEDSACVPHECTSDEDCETGTCQENACILGPDCRVGVDIASIEEAVSRSECVTISLPSGTFEISDIPINRTVRILGKGSTPTILDVNFESRHFTIEDGEYLHIEHVVLRNGSADIGGSILGKSNAELNILDSEIANNRASHEGGAIAFPPARQ